MELLLDIVQVVISAITVVILCKLVKKESK